MKCPNTRHDSGFLNVLKPPGMTSHDVVGLLRKRFSIRKTGHLGTLDPGAGGVLPLALGNATRLIEYIPKQTKGYRVELTLGVRTDTCDAFGKILEEREIPSVDAAALAETFRSLTGTITQRPPMASSIRVKGRHLYQYFREGVEIEPPERVVTIERIGLLYFSPPRMLLDVICSSGTYMRTLCDDIGRILGCGAMMSFLVRFRSGPFLLENSVSINELWNLQNDCRLSDYVVPPIGVLDPSRFLTLDDEDCCRILKGNSIEAGASMCLKEGPLFLQTGGGRLIAAGKIVPGERKCHIEPEKVFPQEGES